MVTTNKYQNETLNTRENTHGDFSITAQYAQGFKDIIKEREDKLTLLQREALDMICSKIARILCGNPNEPDHWKDISGYAQLVEFNLNGLKKDEFNNLPFDFKIVPNYGPMDFKEKNFYTYSTTEP